MAIVSAYGAVGLGKLPATKTRFLLSYSDEIRPIDQVEISLFYSPNDVYGYPSEKPLKKINSLEK